MLSKMGSSQEKPKLIYIGDPMCSWCYGFSPEITKVEKELQNTFDFQLVMGGLRPYNTETMTDLGSFLKEHWEHVAKASEVEFNYAILEDESFVYDTEPPARAVVVVRKMAPNKEFDFFQSVQKAFYLDNVNTNNVEVYLPLLENFEIDKDEFKKLFESDEMKMVVKEDYQLAQSLGVRGFPSTVLQYKGQYYLTSNGFLTAEKLMSNLYSLIKKADQ